MTVNEVVEGWYLRRVRELEDALRPLEWIGECPVKRCHVIRMPKDEQPPWHGHCPDCEVAYDYGSIVPYHQPHCSIGNALNPKAHPAPDVA